MIRLENSFLHFHFLTHSFHQASSKEKKVMSMQRVNHKIKIEIYLLQKDSIQLNFLKTQTFDKGSSSPEDKRNSSFLLLLPFTSSRRCFLPFSISLLQQHVNQGLHMNAIEPGIYDTK